MWERLLEGWRSGVGDGSASTATADWLARRGVHPLAASVYGYLPDRGLDLLRIGEGGIAGGIGMLGDLSATFQGEQNADEMTRDLQGMLLEDPMFGMGLARNLPDAPLQKDLVATHLNNPGPMPTLSTFGVGYIDDAMRPPRAPADSGRGGAGGGQRAKPVIKKSTDLPDLRSMPADEAIRIARGNPHLIEGGAGSEGLFVGGPRNVLERQDLTNIRREADRAVARGAEGGDWYDRYRAAVSEVTDLPIFNSNAFPDSTWMSNLEGQYSAGVSPEGELGFSIRDLNSQIAFDDPGKPARPAQAKASIKAAELGDPFAYQLGKKTGEYARRIDPARGGADVPTATGVNDFRHARTLGYTEASGEAQRNAVGDAGHRFMDYETALMVDRANRKGLAGRNDWTGEQIQAAPWVAQKADDLLSRQRKSFEKQAKIDLRNAGVKDPTPEQLEAATYQVAFSAANTTIADYFPKHTAWAMHEQQPFAAAEHLPLLEGASEADRLAFFNDPRSSWADERGRDTLYAGMRQPGTGNAMRVRPGVDASGEYAPPDGRPVESNPARAARPLIGIETRDGAHRIDPASLALLDAAEATRAYVDVQGATPAHAFFTKAPAKDRNAMRISRDAPLSMEERNRIREVTRKYGMPDIIDTGDGLTITSFGDDTPNLAPKALKAMEKELGLPEGSFTSGRMESNYQDYEGTFGAEHAGTGAATRQFIDRIEALPGPLQRVLDENPSVPRKALANLERDEEMAARFGATREDIQNARRIIGEGPGWVGRLKSAVAAGAVLPSLALFLVNDEETGALPIFEGT